MQTDVVIADLEDAQAVADSDTPAAEWEGFSFNGFHHVQVCTLLSLLKAGCPNTAFEHYLSVVEPVSTTEKGPVVVAVRPEQVGELSTVAGMDESMFESLASSWAATEEFGGLPGSDVKQLLRKLGDLAESASLQGKLLLMWQSL